MLGTGTSVPLSKGAFILSLDTEFAWGDVDLPKKLYQDGQKKERELTQRLLELLDRYDIPATFAVVGALYETPSSKSLELPLTSRFLLTRNWPNRCFIDSFTARDFHAPELMQQLESHPKHEMASHSFSHIIFTSEECTESVAKQEFQSAIDIARKRGYDCISFVFPRNRCAYLDILHQCGFQIYRGEDPAWFNHLSWGGKWGKKIGHILDLILVLSPPCSLPIQESSGLLNLPGSMNYLSMAGWRRYIPLSCRVKQAQKGIQQAIRQKRLFHFWFHPSHLGSGTELLFHGLDTIFEQVARARDAGTLDVFTMKELFQQVSKTNPSKELTLS